MKSTAEYPKVGQYMFLTWSLQSVDHKVLKGKALAAVQFLQDKEARMGCKCSHWSEDGKPPPAAARRGSIPPECQRSWSTSTQHLQPFSWSKDVVANSSRCMRAGVPKRLHLPKFWKKLYQISLSTELAMVVLLCIGFFGVF